jgi:hypothetical protein
MARPKAGSNLSITQLESILSSRLAELQQLTKEHSKLSSQLGEVEKRIAALGGKGKGRGRPSSHANGFSGGFTGGFTGSGRVKNEKSLVETLDQVLAAASGPMKVGDIVDAVLKAGYHTSSDNFRGIVNQTLIKERRRFVSAGRGVYAAKGKPK